MSKMMKRSMALLLALVLTLALAACGGNNNQTNNSQNDQTQNTGNNDAGDAGDAQTTGAADADSYINCLLAAEPSSLDVARFMDTYGRSILMNITEPLTRIVDGVVTGAGAESWTVSEDGLVYTFTLRENTWSDGQPVVAGDYLYALQRQADPNNAWALAADMYSIAGFEAVFTGASDMSALGVEAPDDSTLVITLESPNSAFLSNTDIFPCRQDYVEQYGDAYGAEAANIIGCGPFNLVEWVHSSSLTFEKNESYWNADAVQLQKFTFNIIADTNAQMASFESGALDYINVANSEYIQKFSADSSLVSEPYSAARSYMLVFNCQDEVLSNSKIRLAFSLALDREILAEVITGGTAQPSTGLVPPECTVGSYNFREEAGDLIGALQEANPDPQALLIEGMEEAGLGSDPSTLAVSFAWGATTADARTYLFISHDLSMVRHISDRIAVMYLGSIVEMADTPGLYERPMHPYSRALLSAIPKADPDVDWAGKRIPLTGEVPNPINAPAGCKFWKRCPMAKECCQQTPPPLREMAPGHFVACHRAEELAET